MKTILVLASLVLSSASFAGENPIYRLFPAEITYLQHFDDGTGFPDVGTVDRTRQKASQLEFAEGGVFGNCLAAGEVSGDFDASGRPFIDLAGSGTVICWVRYMEDVPEGKNPGITYFSCALDPDPKTWRRLLMMKQSGIGWMNFFYEYVTDKRYVVCANTDLSFKHWKKGEWKMTVATWTQDKIGFSQDGAPLVETAYEEKLAPMKGRFAIVAPAVGGKGRFYQVDEFAILNRKLSNEEIRTLYDETVRERNRR